MGDNNTVAADYEDVQVTVVIEPGFETLVLDESCRFGGFVRFIISVVRGLPCAGLGVHFPSKTLRPKMA